MPPKFSKKMKTDIEIARSIELVKIKQVARETGIPVEHISNYGRYIAKVDESQIDEGKVEQSEYTRKENDCCLARAVARPLFRNERGSCRRRIRPGVADG